MGYKCDKCNKSTDERLISAYGIQMCEDCWDDYLLTDEGKVEYIIGIVYNDYPASTFDADFLGFAATQFKKNKDQFDFSDDELARIEARANALGIL